MSKAITTSYAAALADPWRSFIAETICIAWVDQAYQVRMAEGFADRIPKIATLAADVAARLAVRGKLSEAKYDSLMRDELHRQLHFLSDETRKALACHWVAEYLRNLRTSD